MANFINPLDKFQSYSFYHILVACNTSIAAEVLLKNTSALLETGRRNQSIEEKYSVKGVDGLGNTIDSKSVNRIGKYMILYNGATDAEFVINSVKWSSVIFPVNDIDSYTTISTEGIIEIIEPNGARFLNIINNCVKKMGVDATGVTFILKTIFVGNNISGVTPQQEVITSVPPIMFIIYDISATFDEVGANYILGIIPLSNGVAKLSQFNQATHALSSLAIKQESTLVDALSDFNSKLNQAYNEHVKTVLEVSNKPGGDFKYIYYLIYHDSIYEDTKKYKVDLFKDQTATTPTGENIISFGQSPTIESALNTIMKHCNGVIEDGNGISKPNEKDAENKDNIKYGYKILSSVESDEDSIFCTYRIVRYTLPTTSLIEQATTGDLEAESLKNNAITFDYFWTGKNKDILSLDIKMVMGLSFLQILSSTDNIPNDKTENKNNEIKKLPVLTRDASQIGRTDDKNKNKIKTVIYFPKSNDNTNSRNTKQPMNSIQYNELLSRFAGLEGLDCRMEVRGNPVFLSNLSSLPSDIRKESKKTTSTGGLSKKEFANFERVPALCKINIKMPAVNTHPGRTDSSISAYEDFWYKGYYYVYNVENIFDGSGEFKQILDLISLPRDLDFGNNDEKIINNNTNPTKSNEDKNKTNASDVARLAKGK